MPLSEDKQKIWEEFSKHIKSESATVTSKNPWLSDIEILQEFIAQLSQFSENSVAAVVNNWFMHAIDYFQQDPERYNTIMSLIVKNPTLVILLDANKLLNLKQCKPGYATALILLLPFNPPMSLPTFLSITRYVTTMSPTEYFLTPKRIIKLLTVWDKRLSSGSMSDLSETDKWYLFRDPQILATFLHVFPEYIDASLVTSEEHGNWVFSCITNWNNEVLRIILKEEVLRKLLLNTPSKEGLTPLQSAVQEAEKSTLFKQCYWMAVRTLLKYNPKMNINTYFDILVYAITHKQEDLQKALTACNNIDTTSPLSVQNQRQITSNRALREIASLRFPQIVPPSTTDAAIKIQTSLRSYLASKELRLRREEYHKQVMSFLKAPIARPTSEQNTELEKLITYSNKTQCTDKLTKHILTCSNENIKKMMLRIIFGNRTHPLSSVFYKKPSYLAYFGITSNPTYNGENLKQLHAEYQRLIVPSSSTADQLPSGKDIGPRSLFT